MTGLLREIRFLFRDSAALLWLGIAILSLSCRCFSAFGKLRRNVRN